MRALRVMNKLHALPDQVESFVVFGTFGNWNLRVVGERGWFRLHFVVIVCGCLLMNWALVV